MKRILILSLFALVLFSALFLNVACQTNSSNPTIAVVVATVYATP